jgi:hypothetical protein
MDEQTQTVTPTDDPLLQTPVPAAPPTNWPKIILFILLGIIVLAGAVYAGMQIAKNQTTKTLETSTTEPVTTPTPTKINPITTAPTPTITKPAQTSTLDSLDNTWNLYTNNLLGFSIKIPKTASEYGGVCTNGKLDTGLVPVKTFSDDLGTYITFEYFYEYPTNNNCQKTTTNLNIIDQRANQWKNGTGNNLIVPGNWHIITTKVDNDNDLENFIKTNYGTGCKIGAKSLSPSGVYDVKILGDGLDLGTTKCPINYIYALKYSPDLHKAATWGIGQAVVFSSSGYKQEYDSDMVNSFKFIN